MPGIHSSFSPSAAERWMSCPASLIRSRMLGDAENSESRAAAEGTLAHAIAEQKLRAGYEDIKPATVKSRITKLKKTHLWEGEPLYKRDMEDCTDDYVSYIGGIYNQLRSPRILIEKKVRMDPISTEMYGTCDCAILADDVLHVIDYKHGINVAVDVTDNPQAKLYAYGVLCDKTVQMLYSPQRIVLHIVQPRNGGTSSWEIGVDDLLAWIEGEVKPVVNGILSGGLANEWHAAEHCQFCPYNGKCKEMYKEGIGENAGVVPEDADPAMMNDEELGHALTRCKLLEMFASRAKKEAEKRIRENRSIPGWDMYRGRSTRSFIDVDAAFKAIAESEGVEPSSYWVSEPLSPNKMAELIGKKKLEQFKEYIQYSRGLPQLQQYNPKKKPYREEESAAEAFADIPNPAAENKTTKKES